MQECPMCYLNLRKMVRDRGMEAVFIIELYRRALEDKGKDEP